MCASHRGGSTGKGFRGRQAGINVALVRALMSDDRAGGHGASLANEVMGRCAHSVVEGITNRITDVRYFVARLSR